MSHIEMTGKLYVRDNGLRVPGQYCDSNCYPWDKI